MKFQSSHRLFKLKNKPFDETRIKRKLQGPAHSKNENLYFLAPAQTKRMQPVSCKAPFRSILQENQSSSEGHEPKQIAPNRMALRFVAFA